jgi:parallel beta-helix repeat protein
MKKQFALYSVAVILILGLQIGAFVSNTNVKNNFNISQGLNIAIDTESQKIDSLVPVSPQTPTEGQVGIDPQYVASAARWQASTAGYQGELISALGKVAYVYMEDNSSAAQFEELIETAGYPTDVFAVSDIVEGIFDGYDLIIVSDDSGWNKAWGTDPSQITAIVNAGTPILGIGEGGYAYFGEIDLDIGSSFGNQGVHGNLEDIVVINENNPIFNNPNPIGSGTINVFTETRYVSLHFSSLPNDITLFGQVPSSEHYPLVLEEGSYLLWGFRETPELMTQTGKDLFVNAVTLLLKYRGPIYIDEDADFNALGFPGDGTEINPYLIDGYRIIDNTATLVHIQDTTAYFTISNTLLDGIDGTYEGINLLRTTHGTISDNNIINCLKGVVVTSSDDFSFSNNLITNNWAGGIVLENSNYVSMEFNSITSNSMSDVLGHGIHLISPCSHNTIVNNEISNNNGDGIYLQHCDFNTISNNTIHHNEFIESGRASRSMGHGIFLNPSNGNTITHNDVYANGEAGIALLQSNYTNIEDNFVHDNEHNGVQLQYSNYNTINQNLIGANGGVEEGRASRSMGHGIFLNPSTHNTISNNEIFGNHGDGVYLYHSNDNTISGNLVHHNDFTEVARASRSMGHGIFLNPSNGNAINNNEVYANGECGIALLQSNYTDIELNFVHDNEHNGVQLQYSNWNTIDQNIIGNNGGADEGARASRSMGHGIFLNPSTHNTISNNEIFNNHGDGVYLYHSNLNTIAENSIHHNDFVETSRASRSMGHGIFLNPSNGNDINSNEVFANGECGIALLQSNYTSIGNNYVHDNVHNGVQLQYSNWNTINQNLIGSNGGATEGTRASRSMGHGIFLNPSTHNTISNNEILNNNGDGVYLYHSNDNTVSTNSIHHNRFDGGTEGTRASRSMGHGIFLNPSNGNSISDNEVFANGLAGIALYLSNFTNIENNYVHENDENGVQLQYSSWNFIKSNTILDNGQATSTNKASRSMGHGIFLNPSNYNKIIDNTVVGNSLNGIQLYHSSNTTACNNDIGNNSLYGINVTDGADDNTIALNNFLNNNPMGTSQAKNDGDENHFVYNHWSDHTNNDGDGNNIADDPYSIDGDSGSQDLVGVATEITETGHFMYGPLILFPNYHDKVTNMVNVEWLPAVDSEGHSMTYDFWYSPDAGKSWIHVASGLTSTNYWWNTTNLQKGSRYKIKIVATCEQGDTSEDVSGKFEIFKIKNPTFPNPDNSV